MLLNFNDFKCSVDFYVLHHVIGLREIDGCHIIAARLLHFIELDRRYFNFGVSPDYDFQVLIIIMYVSQLVTLTGRFWLLRASTQIGYVNQNQQTQLLVCCPQVLL